MNARAIARPDSAPRISVVVPAYNAESLLAATLEGVLRQTLPAWELVVVDDGSTDATADLVCSFVARDPRIRMVRQPNSGVARARNRGLAASDPRTEFAAFLDHDDVWEPDAMETLAGALDDDSGLVGAYGLARCIDVEGKPVAGDDMPGRMRRRRATRGGDVIELPAALPTSFAALAAECCIPSPGCALVRRPLLESAGGFAAETAPCDDWDLWLRLTRRGNLGLVDRVVLNWRRHAGSQSGRSKRWRHAYFLVRDRSARSPHNTDRQALAARTAYRHMWRDELMEARAAVVGLRPAMAARHTRRGLYGLYRYIRATRGGWPPREDSAGRMVD